jgi:localization factor PodJL
MAAYRLGTLYERGHGVPTNAKKADELYGIAAKKGNRKAMHNLAVAFAEGSGVPKNLQQASQWFTRAAEMGLSDSQFNLAVLYERGMGVKQSLTEAYKWYAIAATGGDSESKARVDALATQLTPADKATAQAAAQSFHAKPMDPAANTAPAAADILGG